MLNMLIELPRSAQEHMTSIYGKDIKMNFIFIFANREFYSALNQDPL